MPFTFTAEPMIVRGATSYAERSGMTLERLIVAFLETVALREQKREEDRKPAFFRVGHRLSSEGAEELLAAQHDFERVDVADANYEPPMWHGRELARRRALYEAGKIPTSDWSQVEA
ncbi:MAG: addiction module protein, partial [Afipia sp.]|nr:addiction module protein [Afipia sp.]